MSAAKKATTILQNLSMKEREDFGPGAWKQRRKVIFWALMVCAGCFVGITVTTIILMILTYFYPNALTFDQNLLGLASAIIWASVSTATTIIMGYVFGANLDTKDYRQTLINMPVVPMTPSTTRVSQTTVEQTVVAEEPNTATEPPVPDYVTQANQGEGPKG